MSENLNVIVGLGVTALACARYLTAQHIPIAVTDTRPNPPQLAAFKQAYPNVPLRLGKLDQDLLNQARRLIVSPGISIKEAAIAKARAAGVTVIGDIELFATAVSAPVVAITGTNAKSTVTTLVGNMALAAGKRVQTGGNLGIPALDLLTATATELFVLELSSFQLETTFSLKPRVATILNVTPDHMDRYATVEDYRLAKQRIYSHCDIALCNRDDPATYPDNPGAQTILQFTLQTPRKNEFGLRAKNNEMFLAFEDTLLLPVRELPVLGRHYQANALAALAIGYGYGLPMGPMLATLREFKGLEHRCQLVRAAQGVNWYNDSKGTNVGATLAAIEGLGPEITGRLILIAGGMGKNADFTVLAPAIARYVKTVILMGVDAPILAKAWQNCTDIQFASSMEDAVARAARTAHAGDSVLLSPACASWDMFNNFEHRGKVFAETVQLLSSGVSSADGIFFRTTEQ